MTIIADSSLLELRRVVDSATKSYCRGAAVDWPSGHYALRRALNSLGYAYAIRRPNDPGAGPNDVDVCLYRDARRRPIDQVAVLFVTLHRS